MSTKWDLTFLRFDGLEDCEHMVLTMVMSMKWEVIFEEKGVSSIKFFSLHWFWRACQDCFWTEAVGLSLLSALQGGICWSCPCLTEVWQQNLVHYIIALSVGKDIQPVAGPTEQEEWDKQKTTSVCTDFHLAVLCCWIKSMGIIGKQHQFFL